MVENFMGGGGGCRRVTCPPCMEAALTVIGM